MRRALLERARRLGTSASQASRRACYGSAEQLLLRDYIHRQLYAPGDGYFSRAAPPVAWLDPGLDFAALPTRADYLRAVKAAYERLQVAWLTPSEILTPHYGRAVAAHVLRQHRASDGPLRIVELGAGTGTLARDVLGTIQQADPAAYASCSFTSVEISPALAATQRARVAQQAGHAQRFTVELRDAADACGWGPPDARPCFILGMEVLDNCAHDRVERAADGGWLQEQVALSEAGPQLLQAPLSDALIQAVLAEALSPEVDAHAQQGSATRTWLDWLLPAGPSQEPYSRCAAAFLPTKAAQLLDTLAAVRPRHRLLLGDFSQLPDVTIPGRNAPLVATTAGGRTTDHSSYTVPQGTADIFFPTDFRLLQALHARSCRRAGEPCPAPLYKQRTGAAKGSCAVACARKLQAAEAACICERPVSARGLSRQRTRLQRSEAGTGLPRAVASGSPGLLLYQATERAARPPGGRPCERTACAAAGGGALHAGTRAVSEVLSNRGFMRRFADGGATRLRDGWDPLAQDYSNTAFLLASSEPQA